MVLPLFPDLPRSQGWSTTRQQRFRTRIQTSVSGRENRLIDQLYPTWIWTLNFEVLRDQWDKRNGPGLGQGIDELRRIFGLYLACRGSALPFLFEDPSDRYVQDQVLAAGDGSTTQFAFWRTLPYGFSEPVLPNEVEGVFIDGAWTEPSLYSVDTDTGLISFSPAPDSGVVITADFSYRWKCRFSDDNLEAENFMYQLWTMKQVKIQSVLL